MTDIKISSFTMAMLQAAAAAVCRDVGVEAMGCQEIKFTATGDGQFDVFISAEVKDVTSLKELEVSIELSSD